ncbi:High mobility group HMG-I/HMG-Y [Penicillium angulare]|uniref:High mobility group HMG-I/HMG-Y n=1 Tax=Penicillium angulare TaxID=116970 RepID=UPI00253FC894|nr:High mobility group HMG-I/HMG-Y [Penicillium angulare]KAJ5280817.1 High mobility group HMG-I/HMG-Y [Penicillium angulare]
MPLKRKSARASTMADSGAATPSKRVRNSLSNASGEVVSEATPKAGDKRKRGRPRKNPEGTLTKPSTDGPKRGRGRPRKILSAAETAAAAKKAATADNTPKKGRGRPRKEPGTATPKVTPTGPKKKDGRGRPRKSLPANGADTKKEAAVSSYIPPNDDSGRSYWLMKAEPESRLEKGVDVKFSIDDLASAEKPEAWDGVRNHVARNLMCEMKKGDYAFFYHSNCKTPGVVGVMEIVQEHSTDESAFDPNHPYHDPKASRENPKWVVVHVEFRRKLKNQVTLHDLKAHSEAGMPLEDLQTLKQARLSISSVTSAQWHYILQLAGDNSEESTKTESKVEEDEDMDAENEEDTEIPQ